MTHRIPTTVRNYAIAHSVNLGRNEHGSYTVRDAETGQIVAMTISAKPTALNALAMMRRLVSDRA